MQSIVAFQNKYGASIVQAPWSMGGSQGLFEMELMLNGEIVESDIRALGRIADPTMGYLTVEQVELYLDRIAAMLPRGSNKRGNLKCSKCQALI